MTEQITAEIAVGTSVIMPIGRPGEIVIKIECLATDQISVMSHYLAMELVSHILKSIAEMPEMPAPVENSVLRGSIIPVAAVSLKPGRSETELQLDIPVASGFLSFFVEAQSLRDAFIEVERIGLPTGQAN